MDQNPVLLMHGALDDRQPKQGVKGQLLSDLHGLVIMQTEKTVGVRLASHHMTPLYFIRFSCLSGSTKTAPLLTSPSIYLTRTLSAPFTHYYPLQLQALRSFFWAQSRILSALIL
jgi:hypothetical protein